NRVTSCALRSDTPRAMGPTRARLPIGRHWRSAIAVFFNYGVLVMTSARRVGSRIEAEDQFPPGIQGIIAHPRQSALGRTLTPTRRRLQFALDPSAIPS